MTSCIQLRSPLGGILGRFLDTGRFIDTREPTVIVVLQLFLAGIEIDFFAGGGLKHFKMNKSFFGHRELGIGNW